MQVLPTSHPDPVAAGAARLEVALQGVSAGGHRVAVRVGGTEAGETVFSGKNTGREVFAVDHNLLDEGETPVTLTALGGDADVSLVESVRITYRRLYRADGNSLRCAAPAGTRIEPDGFGDPRIRVLDVTDPERPYWIAERVRAGETGYRVSFGVSGRGVRTLSVGSVAGVCAFCR